MRAELKPVAGLLLLIAGGLLIRAQLTRPPPLSDHELRVAYRINWNNFSANCRSLDAGASRVRDDFCREAAGHLGRSPHCDPGCREALSPFGPRG